MKPAGTEGNSNEARGLSPVLGVEVDRPSSDASLVVREIEIQAEIPLPDGGVELIEVKIEEVEAPEHAGHQHHHSHEGQHGPLVEVTVDNREVCVKEGAYVVAVFKAAVGVAADRLLDRVLGPGKFEELSDDQTIHVHAREVFVSHVKQGSSS
ncbi:hypothetical protein [Burkholderia stagnalis]|uniref:hypothetical protein n=1 Tax=Burkholderia stagnalis TaxID=1503054 RepID=UPI000AE75503|nr:hypothetical protein [Burkholderia stagnalis]